MIGTRPLNSLLHSVYEPLPWQIAPWRDKSPVLLLTGSAGGGKSRLAAEKLHGYMLKYPRATGLALRKAREFATKSVVPMMRMVSAGETELVEMQGGHIRRTIKYGALPEDSDYKKAELAFHYRNGSLLYIGGMKDDSQREALRSIGQNGALDIAWMEEGTAFTFQDFQELRTRMRGTVADWRQIIITTNPGAPLHWIYQKLILEQRATVYYSSATDNPYNPADYLDTLNTLEGIQRDRLVLGRWVQAEGVVYDNFSTEENVTVEAEYNPVWDIIWGVDDGYAAGKGPGDPSYHPRIMLLGQVTPIGGLNIFAEYAKTGVTDYKATITDVLSYGYPYPEVVYIDSSAAMFKGALFEADFYTQGMTHPVHEGIKNLRRLICDGKKQRLLKVHPRCTGLIREFMSYRYSDGHSVAQVGEPKPLKVDDHYMDALRYMAYPLRHEQ